MLRLELFFPNCPFYQILRQMASEFQAWIQGAEIRNGKSHHGPLSPRPARALSICDDLPLLKNHGYQKRKGGGVGSGRE